jgi:enoyl-CoA hydratase/carnithine racemase
MHERSGMLAGSPEEITEQYRLGIQRIQRIPRAFQRLEVPIIAAVNGAAMGAGCDLACMCDIRIASRNACFAESFVKVGIVPGDGGCWFLPRIVGESRTAEMAFTGETLSAEDALRIGLVSRVTQAGGLLPDALALARRIAANPPQVLRWTKRLLRHARHSTLDESLDEAGVLQGLAHHTAEHAEAVQAFFDKRPPRFGAAGKNHE